MVSTAKIPELCMASDDKKNVELTLTGRGRDSNQYLECKSSLYSNFKLISEMNGRYEYYLQGNLAKL